MAGRQYELGAAELEVLNVLWDDGPATVRAVLNRLRGQGRRLAYTTVLTFLTRLDQKGYVSSDKSGLAYVYRPTISRERVRRSRLEALVRDLYDGAAGALVLQLVRKERLSAEEIRDLRALIDELDPKDKRHKS